jgi:uncharacterized protein YndB with AHSA1/START domain
MSTPTAPPDLSGRPLRCEVWRLIAAPPAAVYEAWTTGWERWFAAPGTLLVTPEVDGRFFFEVRVAGQRHPHYGRYLRLEPAALAELTWVTAGTKGTETVLTVTLEAEGAGTRLSLVHQGFADDESRAGHAEAWPHVLDQLDRSLR